ncbi:MAG: LamG domain-containing protein, partial [Bacteroidota bacterium]
SALNFDGTASIEIPDSPSLDPRPFLTVEAWVNPTDASGSTSQWIVYRDSSSWGLYAKNNAITFYADTRNGGGSWKTCYTSITSGEWTHVAVVYDGTNILMYKNGELQRSCAQTGDLDVSSRTLFLGASSTAGAGAFNGKLDELKIYYAALSETQINADLEGSLPDEVLRMTFDDGLATDDSPFENDGTIYGATVATGHSGSGLDFNGSAYVEIDSSDSLAITEAITLEAWVNPDDAASPAYQYVVQRSSSWGFYTRSGSISLYTDTRNDGGAMLACRTPITSGTWTHIAGTYDGTNMMIYKNGVLANTCAQAHLIDSTIQDVLIGASTTALAYPYQGMVDDVVIKNRALSAEEIAEEAGL